MLYSADTQEAACLCTHYLHAVAQGSTQDVEEKSSVATEGIFLNTVITVFAGGLEDMLWRKGARRRAVSYSLF